MANNVTYRVGMGRSASGKILDRNTKWFTDLDEAMEYAIETQKDIYISINKSPYKLLYECKMKSSE